MIWSASLFRLIRLEKAIIILLFFFIITIIIITTKTIIIIIIIIIIIKAFCDGFYKSFVIL